MRSKNFIFLIKVCWKTIPTYIQPITQDGMSYCNLKRLSSNRETGEWLLTTPGLMK